MGITLPILRRAGERGEFGVVSGADSPLLGLVVTPALTKGESLCHPAGSTFHTLAASSQGGASLPGAALRRQSSKVRAVCDNSAPTDPCGRCEAARIPTATSPFVVCQPATSGVSNQDCAAGTTTSPEICHPRCAAEWTLLL